MDVNASACCVLETDSVLDSPAIDQANAAGGLGHRKQKLLSGFRQAVWRYDGRQVEACRTGRNRDQAIVADGHIGSTDVVIDCAVVGRGRATQAGGDTYFYLGV